MTDIVAQMRASAKWLRGSWKATHHATGDLIDEGAAEIERLRRELESLRAVHQDTMDYYPHRSD